MVASSVCYPFDCAVDIFFQCLGLVRCNISSSGTAVLSRFVRSCCGNPQNMHWHSANPDIDCTSLFLLAYFVRHPLPCAALIRTILGVTRAIWGPWVAGEYTFPFHRKFKFNSSMRYWLPFRQFSYLHCPASCEAQTLLVCVSSWFLWETCDFGVVGEVLRTAQPRGQCISVESLLLAVAPSLVQSAHWRLLTKLLISFLFSGGWSSRMHLLDRTCYKKEANTPKG